MDRGRRIIMITCFNDIEFLTNFVYDDVKDGAGAQVHRRLSVWAYCILHDIRYVHTPLQSVEHNYESDSSWESKWEEFFNLGKGKHQKTLDTKSEWYDHTLHDRTYHVSQLIHWFNVNGVDLYDKVKEKFLEKYNLTKKPKLYFDKDYVNIAVHVRRGDLVGKGHRFNAVGLPDEYYIKVMKDIQEEYNSKNKKCKFYVYTQNKAAKRGFYRKPKKDLFKNFEELDFDVEMKINGCPFSDIHHLLMSDVLISSKSHFSYIPSLFTNARVVHCFDKNQAGLPKTYWDVRDRNGNKLKENNNE